MLEFELTGFGKDSEVATKYRLRWVCELLSGPAMHSV